MGDVIDFFRMIWLLLVVIFHTTIFLIGLFFLPFFIWKHYDDQKKRSVDMAFEARKIGMTMDRALDRRLSQTYGFLRKIGGSRRYALNIVSGTSQGHSVTLFEYHYQRYFRCKSYEFDKYIEHNYLSFYVLDLEQDLPILTVKEEKPASRILARISDALGRGDIDFESHEFSEKYDVRSNDKKFAYDFCNTQMMEYLLEKTSVPIEVEGEALAILYPDNLDFYDNKPRLEHLVNIRNRMPAYLFTN